MHMYDLETPALVVDLDVLERNIRNMATHCRNLGIDLRVHAKTHKIPEIARMQLNAGSKGIVCQRLIEAEVMAEAGIDDILVTYNIVGKQALKRLSDLAKCSNMMVTVDSEIVAAGISQQAQVDDVDIRVLIELDTGGKRTGVQSPEAALELGKKVMDLPGLSLQGIMIYPSDLRGKPFIEKTVDLFQQAGLPYPIISGGGTGHEAISKELGCTETRSGSYVYEGMTRVHGGEDLGPEHCALSVLMTVVSVPTMDRVIIDGGMKTLQAFPANPYGYIIEYPQAKLNLVSVEHGHVDISQCDHRFQVGEKLRVIPRHAGMTTNLHDEVVAVRDGQVEAVWRVQARGVK